MQDGSSVSSSIKLHLTANNEHAAHVTRVDSFYLSHTHTHDDPNNTIHVRIVDIVSVRMTRIGGARREKKKGIKKTRRWERERERSITREQLER